MVARIYGRDAGLFLDLAAYSIITEDNAILYCQDYAITTTQKAILKAFGITSDNVYRMTRDISSDLSMILIEAKEKEAAQNSQEE